MFSEKTKEDLTGYNSRVNKRHFIDQLKKLWIMCCGFRVTSYRFKKCLAPD